MQTRTGLGAIRNLDYTILLCDNLDAMKAFYVERLGFEIHHEIPGFWVALQIGASLLTLRPRGRPYDGPSPPISSASVQLAFRVPPSDSTSQLPPSNSTESRFSSRQLTNHGATEPSSSRTPRTT